MNDYNYSEQNYKGLKLQLKERNDYRSKKAKEYYILNPQGFLTTITIWIPNRYLYTDGEINIQENFMFIFNKEEIIQKLYNAGWELKY